MPAPPRAVYFADENALDLAKLLRRTGREDVYYPGHQALPQEPLGTPDLGWMKIVARRKLVVLTRDRRIRSRPAELKQYTELGIGLSGSVRSRISAPRRDSSCSSDTRVGFSVKSSSAGPVRGRWQ